MKRNLSFVLAFVTILTVLLTGCNQSTYTPDSSESLQSSAQNSSAAGVPDYVGKKYDDVKDESQFKIVREYDPDKPEGVIIRQEPETGTVLDDKTITIVVNSIDVDVPDFVGKRLEDVKSDSRYHFEYAISYENDPSNEEGVILRQSPEPNTKLLKYNGTIHLIVNKYGITETEVPKVKNYEKDQAIEKLKNKELIADVAYLFSTEVVEGYVIDCTPCEGYMVDNGSTVTLIVSAGPYQEGYRENSYDTSEMTDKDYSGTHSISELSDIFESDDDNMVAIPDLVGYKYDDIVSLQTSESKIIVVSASGKHYSETFPEGVIMAQKPEPDTQTGTGSLVVVYVSDGKKN